MTSEKEPLRACGEPLDQPANLAGMRELWQDGLLSDEAYRAARGLLLPHQVWREWASRHLLFVGTGLVLAGVIFFFAYNWQDMGRFLKLGVIALGMVFCAVGAQVAGLGTLVGKTLILSASILVGVLLAVFGQVYQTGADAYELFLGWGLLIFLWVLLSEFAALWFVWLVVLHSAVIAWWVQVAEPAQMPFGIVFFSVALFDGLALTLREFFLELHRDWLGAAWFRSALALTFLVFLSTPALVWIFDPDEVLLLGAFSPLLWLGGAAAFFAAYRYRLRDVLLLSYLALDISVVLCCFLVQAVLEGRSWESSNSLFLCGFIVLAVVGGIAMGLRALMVQMAKENAQAMGGGTES